MTDDSGVHTAGRSWRHQRRLWIVGLAAGAVTAAGLGTAPAVWAGEHVAHHRQALPSSKPGTAVPLHAATAKEKDPAVAAAKATADLLKKPVKWPTSANVTVKVPGGKATAATASAAGGLTVTVAPHAAATAAGVDGALMKVVRPVSAKGAAAKVSLDYSGFAYAFGGDFGSRLTLVRMPACALTTPKKAACRTRTPLSTDNNVTAQTLTATVPTASTSGSASTFIIATDATPTSGAGTYKATSLGPSASWSAGGSSGDFTWSYPLSVPPAAAGPAPNLSIDYDSQSVDGRLPSTNNQPSWIGEGFDLGTSYIERSYDSCDDDGTNAKGKYDECWANDNATMVLNGKSTPLIKDTKSGGWHPKDDDGERVVRCSNGTSIDKTPTCPGTVNGDAEGEYWIVTTTDGTQYVFGKNRLPGWASGNPETNSTLTVPIYGDDSGEPCNGATFAASSCKQAWRWNLDYVVDTHHNAMSYWYTKEFNAYGQNGTTTATGTTYDRGAYLDHINYGITDSTFFGNAPDQVKFATAERCLVVIGSETCASLTAITAKDWPDVPFDQICATGTVCKTTPAPTFFSRKRLTGITTKVWDASLTTPGYRNVDQWDLDQEFLAPGDGTSSSLWLDSITRTGEDGTALPVKPVTFEGENLPNRVDTSHDDIAALNKWRVRKITTETGSAITVNYNDNDPMGRCVAGTTMPAAPDNDTLRCYPVMWTPPFMTDPQLDYFHKYVVEQVVQSDPTGGAPNQETDYTYANPAWHYDTDDVTSPAKDITWSQWRGFGLVTTTTGDNQTTRTMTVDTYYQGMDGDKQSSGPARSATVVDSNGTHVTDADPLAGNVRESRTLNGSAEVSSTITDEWTNSTGTDGTRSSYYVRPSSVHTRTDRTSGAPRTTTVNTTYDSDTGAATKVDNEGDDAVTGDETCTSTTYASNNTNWLRAAPVETETRDVPCSAWSSATLPDDVVSDARSLYDNLPYGTAPTIGNVTSTQRMSSYSGSTPVYQTVSTTTYDSQGRVLTLADADGNTSTTAYTPATGGPLTSTLTTDAKGYQTTTTYDPARNLQLSVVDPNSHRTDYAYDALGRVTSVWLANRVKSVGQTASYTFAYGLSKTQAYVQTGTLRSDGATYNYSYAIYDAMLRPRQTQTPAPGGGRVITETKYDSRGLAVEADADYHDATDPSGTLENITSVEPSQTRTTYDGAGRPTAADFYADGAHKWSTTTIYGGDRTTVIPPSGGIATTTLTDALGRTTETRQYDNGAGTGSYTSIKYGYNAKNQLHTVTDPGNSVWTYGYDLMGRQTSTTDPDAGYSSSTYTDLDQLASTTDSRGKTLSYTYDELGRKTGEYDAPTGRQTADNQLAKWTYDNVAKGRPTSSIRYVGGSGTTGKMYVTQVAAYDVLYRPTTTRFIIPSVTGEEALAGTYSTTLSYNLDGTLQTQSDPAEGGLPSESLTSTYNTLGMPTSLKSSTAYVTGTNYSPLGQLWQVTLGATAGPQVQQTNTYEDGTGRLNRQLVTDDTGSNIVQDSHYAYDAAGNPTMVDARANSVDDTQCYQYDGHDRLTAAFTSTDTWQTTNPCATAPTTATLGSGPAPYWQAYTYDPLGNRKQLTQHAMSPGTPDTTTTYGYGAPDGTQPHTLTASKTTAPGSTTTNSYVYDKAGNTTTRDLNGTTQSLTWDDEGNQDSAANADGTSASYLYDADGNRLLTRDATGTTLYLGDSEIHLAKGTTSLSGTRYYTYAGQTVAVRTSGGTLQWVLDDAHDTATSQIDPTTQAVTFRRTDPFGNDRGTAPTAWAGDHGFVNGVQDTTTSLTHLGARDYDPSTGRFTSLDPLLELTDPQQINGYAYAADNPVTSADPDGLRSEECGTGIDLCTGDNHHDNDDTAKADDTCGSGESCSDAPPHGNTSSSDTGRPATVEVYPTIAVPTSWKNWLKFATALDTRIGKDCATFSSFYCDDPTSADSPSGRASLTQTLSTDVFMACSDIGGCPKEINGSSVSSLIAADAAALAGPDDIGEGGAGRRGGGSCNSFSPDTQVLLDGGRTKKLKDMRPGDKVEAGDPDTGKHEGPRAVTATHINHDTDLVDVTVQTTPGHTATLHTTANHPFWDDTTHTWVPAGKLQPGHALNTNTNHHATVLATHPTPGAANRYNLTVDQLHTYYVLAGTTPVLVHNSNGLCGVTSAIHDDPYLVKAAEAAGKNQRIQKEMDDLVMQFRGGNTNPGLGNKSLAGTDVSYLRGRNGGRVFFRNTGDGMQIVGKADKSNESKVISRLTDMYGN